MQGPGGAQQSEPIEAGHPHVREKQIEPTPLESCEGVITPHSSLYCDLRKSCMDTVECLLQDERIIIDQKNGWGAHLSLCHAREGLVGIASTTNTVTVTCPGKAPRSDSLSRPNDAAPDCLRGGWIKPS